MHHLPDLHQKRNKDSETRFIFKLCKVRNSGLLRSMNLKIQKRSLDCAKYLYWNVLQKKKKKTSIMNV